MAAGTTYSSVFEPKWSSVVKDRAPAFAASDVIAGTIVGFLGASGQANNVQMLATTNVEPLGVVRDDQVQYGPVAVFTRGNTCRGLCGASLTAGAIIGVSGVTAVTHPLSNNTVNAPVLGTVAGASGSKIYRVGIAEENANPGQIFSFRVDPTQLSGLA